MIKKKKQKKQIDTTDFHELLIKRLKDHEFAVEYLNTAIEESLKGDEESQQLFLKALRNVAQAHGTMSTLAKRAKLRRESLYKIFSENGNPELNSLVALLYAMGFQLSVR